MASSWVLVCFWFLLLGRLCFSQSNPQNIETFYPGTEPVPGPVPGPVSAPEPESGMSPTPYGPNHSRSEVVRAVVLTAASTLIFAAVFFYCLQRYCLSRRRRRGGAKPRPNSFSKLPVMGQAHFGPGPAVVVDDDDDVLFWRRLAERNSNNNNLSSNSKKKHGYEVLPKNNLNRHEEDQKIDSSSDLSKKPQPTPEIPLLNENSSISYDFNPQIEEKPRIQVAPAPPPPPRGPPAPPMPPRAKGSNPPPPPPKGLVSNGKKIESSSGGGGSQLKMKPLHWDKLSPNTDHSMVWNKLNKGSFKFDSDLMESLFGYVGGSSNSSAKPKNSGSGSSASQIVILDPRKSQNIAIVLKSLAISHNELLNGLREGQGLEADTIEKLTRIAPTEEEQIMILGFEGDPERLADAESFLYHVLKSVPSAFTRLSAMHFRLHYGSEVAHVNESLKALELGCNELRTGGLFMKLLEAILKAGNRMNAGTARGNAQAFNLTALRKLSDVKSTDGKTTLLHFVVEEVVRSEGKKCIINRDRNLNRNNSLSSDMSKEEREKQYTMLGLPVVGGLSSEFTNVKKSASIDYDSFAATHSNLSSRVSETKTLVMEMKSDGVGGFVREMQVFLEKAEQELSFVKEEQWRVMELVKRTTEYYQAGAFKDKGAAPLQLFIIVKDFLSMVDQVCIEIARNLQRRKAATATSPALRSKAKFLTLPKHFMSEKSETSSSDSDEE